ncbi:hypothetical protein DFH05DRAFT_1521558 [Lentinula detonsa]|uniref:Uncharacterized protein n=1 Tax=Lentinula detonsa TaxID=2804962 RepID=A0A9W8P545_9AGAR|nr:hypothetical protein DFH05DRAFT_1521558 [Lentinula detonsa]
MAAVLVARVNQQELGRSATPLLNVWICFNLVSNIILLPILVLTFVLSKKVTKRHPSLINVCITWIFFGIFSLLLFFGGRARPTDPNPSSALCIVQTSLLYGIPPMWSVAIFVLMYFILGIVSADGRSSNVGKGHMLLMLGAPYIVQLGFSLATLVISLQNPQYVTRQHRFFYCALEYPPLSNAMSIFTLIFCLAIITIQFRICLVLYRNYRGLTQAGESMVVDLQFLVRVVVFGVFIITGMFVDVLSMFSQRSVAPDLYVATAGTIVFLVFGSQADVLRVWCFWRKDGPIRVSPASSRESVWANFDLNRSPRKNRTIISESSVTLPPPIPVHLANHIHESNL